jgi:hypothetical protein
MKKCFIFLFLCLLFSDSSFCQKLTFTSLKGYWDKVLESGGHTFTIQFIDSSNLSVITETGEKSSYYYILDTLSIPSLLYVKKIGGKETGKTSFSISFVNQGLLKLNGSWEGIFARRPFADSFIN